MAVTHSPADRQFYSIESDAVSKSHFNTPTTAEKEKLLDYVASSIIGKDKTFCGPFGERRAVYLDYIASGRALSFIEDYIQKEVLPEYGNTHTTTSVTSLQTTLFRHEARDIIRNAVNASEHDSVIFTGSGSTGTIHKLIHALNLKEPPVVFVGPFEHHSNLLPWRELASEVVSIRQTKDGVVDVCHLEQQLQAFANSGCQLIGSFNAASNVTGILCDVDSITILLHKYGALALWDYATAGPYVRLDMNPVLTGEDSCLVYKDAMFISPHKFMGGVCTPGVLIAKKNLFHSNVPKECGGGTVFFVRREAHRYLHEPELREEGGTPNIVGSIRTGMVFQLKMAITPELIMEKERSLCRQAIEAWRSVPNLVILGNLQAERLPVFSFLVHHPASGRFLHYNYVSVLLNDLFGIQARGGCACAGPYSMELLGLAEETAAEIEKLLAEDSRLDRVHLRRYTEYSPREIIRPGFTRLNLPYFISEEQLDFVLQAVAMVTEHGWKLLPQYMFNPDTGEWRHKEHQVFKERKWLGHVSYASGHMQYSVPRVSPKAPLPQSFQECLNVAKQLFIKAEKSRFKLADQSLMFDEEARPYRWFLLPSEANQILCGSTPMVPCTPSDLPFCPPELRERWTTGQEMQDVEWTVVNGQTASARSASAFTASADGGDVWVCPKEGSSDLHTTSSARLCQDIHSSAEKNSSDNSIQESGDNSPSQGTRSSRPPHPQQSESSHESAASSVDLGADGSASCDGFSHVVQTAMERGYWDNVSSCSGPASISLHGDYEVRTVLPQTNPAPVFGPAAAVREDSAWAPGRGHGDASAERTESTRESLSSRQSPPVLADSDRTCRGEPLTPRTTPPAADATTVTGICTLESTRSRKKEADRELHVEEGTSNPGTQRAGSGEHGTESTSNPGTQRAGSGEHGTESTSNPGTQRAGSGEQGTESTSNPGTQRAGSGEQGTESTSNPGTQQARSGEHGTESTSNPGTQQAGSGEHGTESTSNPGMQQARSGEHGTESTSNPGTQQARSGEQGTESTSNPGTQQAGSGEHGTESTSNPGTQQAGSGEHGTESTSNPRTPQARSGRKGTESTSNPGMQQARSGEHGTESTSNQGMQQARSAEHGTESTSNPGMQQARSGEHGTESTSNQGMQQARSGEHGTESTSNQGMQQARSGDSNPGTQQARSGEHGTESTSNPGAQQARYGEHGTESTSSPGVQQARSGRKGTESTTNPGMQQARSGDSNQGMQQARSTRKGRESTSNPGAQLAMSGRNGRESTSNPGAQLAMSGRKGRESTSNPGAQLAMSGRKGRESTSNPGAQQARSGRKGREFTSNPGVQQARSGRKGRECGRRWVPPTKEIFKLSVKAMQEYSMIRDGDRVLLCLSGGKDSLSLLHVLHQYQFYCRSQGIDFDLGAVTVDPQTPSYDPSPLKLYLAALGVPYFYESQCIMETAVNLPYECASICSFCSRMKRGRIYAAARREGYNVLALGQHLDDLAESFIMSLFHNGSLRTMKAHYTVQEGDLRVVRPFVYVREKDLRNFAEKSKLPVITENCPACFESPKERHRTKQLLASQEILFPRLYSSIMSAIKPVMALSRTGVSATSCIAAAHPANDLDID